MTNKNLSLISIGILLIRLFTISEAFKFNSCVQSKGKLISASISACPDTSGSSCVIRTNQQVEYSVNLTTVEDFDDADLYMAVGTFSDVSHACDYGVRCPSKANSVQRVQRNITITDQPNGNFDLYIEILAAKGVTLFCVTFPVTIIQGEKEQLGTHYPLSSRLIRVNNFDDVAKHKQNNAQQRAGVFVVRSTDKF